MLYTIKPVFKGCYVQMKASDQETLFQKCIVPHDKEPVMKGLHFVGTLYYIRCSLRTGFNVQ